MGATALAAQDAKAPAVRAHGTVPVTPVANVAVRTGAAGNAAPEARRTQPPEARGAAAPKPAARSPGGAGARRRRRRAQAGRPKRRRTRRTPSRARRVAARPVSPVVEPSGRHVPGEVDARRGSRRRAGGPPFTRYRSTRDSIAGESARAAAERGTGLRVVVQLDARELAVLDGADTLLVAPVAIGRDTTIRYGTRTWSFDTPRGKRAVRRKDENPKWIPPDWHYVEVASRKGFKLAYLPANGGVSLGGGRRLVVKNGLAGVQEGKTFTALPTDEELVFGNTLYVPPLGSKNRQIEGELGRFRLDLGDGYQLHGTPHEDTIGDAATHGCIRLYDEDVEWLYQHVPLGTPVYIF
jgi:hypothetical protein